jgi:hypothetical protein
MVWLLLVAALAMSVGWGFRGDYGHEAGAMVPGALLGLAICLAARRADWWPRASLLAMAGAIGWAFGGQMSYAMVVGYTVSTSYLDVAYGYGCLFLIGLLWSGIGSAVLALGLTEQRSRLERVAGPLIAFYLVWLFLHWSGLTRELSRRWPLHDTDWVTALATLGVAGVYGAVARPARHPCRLLLLLAGGWCIGVGLLTGILGLHMTPPRSDNWAGCVGLLAALLVYLLRTQNRAGLLLTLYGMLAGGLGFAIADFVHLVGRSQWGPLGRYDVLQGLDYWKWMEQLFGLLMGLGVALGVVCLLRGRLIPAKEDEANGPLRTVAPLFLFVVMMWENLFKNVRSWQQGGSLSEGLLGIDPRGWFLLVGLFLSAIVVLGVVRYRRGALPLVPASTLGRGQFLFLLLLWIPVIAAFMQAFPGLRHKGVLLVHVTFWITATVASLIVLALPAEPIAPAEPVRDPRDRLWLPGWKHWLLWALVPVLVLLLARLSVAIHPSPLEGSHLRFANHPAKSFIESPAS